MRLLRPFCAALPALALLQCAPALALRDAPGGFRAPAPRSLRLLPAGGVSSSAVPHRPVVSELSVPSSSAPGAPPRVVLRIDEPGVSRVYAVVAVHDVATGRAAVTARLGWIATGRAVSVRWPAGAALTPGSYRVGVSAHDPAGVSLLRRAHASGVAALLVSAPSSPPLTPPAPVPAPAPEAGVPTPAQTLAAGAVFPVLGSHEFGGPENRFGAPRGTHFHEGQDVLTAEGTPVLAPLAGTITWTSYQAGGAGYYAVEHSAIGLDFMFAHCQEGSLQVSANQPVSAGSELCRAGQTGDATAPHLHFEVWVGGWQASGGHSIDPLPYLLAWEHGA